MANDLNQCNFIGRLGSDPEMRYLSDGKAVANIRIACGWKTKEKEGAEWVPIVFYGRLAEVVGEYLRKGSQVFVSGSFRTRKWEKDGQTRYTTEIIASEMQMLGGRNGSESPSRESSAAPAPATTGGEAFADFSDDIPF